MIPTDYLEECLKSGSPARYLGIILGRNPESRKSLLKTKISNKMNRLEQLLEDIKELSNTDNIQSADEMQNNLEEIHDMIEEFQLTIFDYRNDEDDV